MSDRGGRWGDGPPVAGATTDEGNSKAEVHHSRQYVWDPVGLAWVRMTQPSGGGGGGGGAVTVADGADVAQGATTDASSSNTVIGLLKAIKAAVQGTLTTARNWTLSSATDSVNVGNFPATQPVSAASLPLPTGAATETTLGNVAKDATLTSGNQIVQARGKLWNGTAWIDAPGDATNGAKVQIATALPAGTNTIGKVDQGAAGAAAWKVDASGAAVPVTDNAGSLTVDAPVSAPVSVQPIVGGAAVDPRSIRALTTADAVNVGQWIGSAAPTVGQKAMASSIPVTLASDQGAVPTKETAATLVGTTISAANAAVTLTLAAVASQFHYITSIEIVAVNPTATAIAGSAVTLAYTTTNLNGLAWTTGNALAAGAEKVVTRMQFGPPLRSAVVNTATTIVAPAIGAGGLVRITVTYYTAA